MPTPSETIRAAIAAVAEDEAAGYVLTRTERLHAFAKALERATDALLYLSTRAEARDALADIASLLSAAQEGK
jgi:hypothetical protein